MSQPMRKALRIAAVGALAALLYYFIEDKAKDFIGA